MKKQLIALGAFLVLALGALPSMASCPCQSQSYFQYPVATPCCPAAPVAAPCCPAVKPCCPIAKPCCPAVKPCCPDPCMESCPCPAAPIQEPCCNKPATCDDCCD